MVHSRNATQEQITLPVQRASLTMQSVIAEKPVRLVQDNWAMNRNTSFKSRGLPVFSLNREPLNPQHIRTCQRIRNVDFTKGTPLIMKRVNVPELDTLFDSIAETFNKQQDHCLSLQEAIQTLRNSCDCSPLSSLSVCMEKILQEHSAYNVQVCMEGYRFWLDVGVEEVPQKLKQTQQQMEKLNFATKGIVSTRIEEMIYSVHQCQESLMEKVKDSSPEYLDWIRLESNLKENIEKINQAQKYSEEYREEADCVLLNMAKSANLTL